MNLSPSDWFNINGDFQSIFEDDKSVSRLTDKEYQGTDTDTMSLAIIFKNIPSTKNSAGYIEVCKNNNWKIPIGRITKFSLLTEVKFKGDWQSAQSYVNYYLIGTSVPYIRVVCDYYKVIKQIDRSKIEQTIFKLWKKDEITQDHGKAIFPLIPKFDSFIIEPNNKEYMPIIGNNYNQYAKFPHKEFEGDVNESDIPVTINFLKHIFGEQFELGLKYFKILYEYPRQILPILTLVSIERSTGKTTLINFTIMLFGANAILISPEEISKNHNSLYSDKNIIMIDEAGKEKEIAMEKLKSMATAKYISVDPKFVQQYQLPFFGKIILCTNKEKNFMRIEDEEIRFWIRKIKKIEGKKNINIEDQLRDEIPKFLKYLAQLPAINFDTDSRMFFTPDELQTDALNLVKNESKKELHKELEQLINNHCTKLQITSFYADPADIKQKWFHSNNNISLNYIRNTVKDDMKIYPSVKTMRYSKFSESLAGNDSIGKPFLFTVDKEGIILDAEDTKQNDDLPF